MYKTQNNVSKIREQALSNYKIQMQQYKKNMNQVRRNVASVPNSKQKSNFLNEWNQEMIRMKNNYKRLTGRNL